MAKGQAHGTLCVLHAEERPRDGDPETPGPEKEGHRAEEVKRWSLAAAVINAPGMFTNMPAETCVEARLGDRGWVRPGPPGACLHSQRGHCPREAPNIHSSPESGPREPWEVSG